MKFPTFTVLDGIRTDLSPREIKLNFVPDELGKFKEVEEYSRVLTQTKMEMLHNRATENELLENQQQHLSLQLSTILTTFHIISSLAEKAATLYLLARVHALQQANVIKAHTVRVLHCGKAIEKMQESLEASFNHSIKNIEHKIILAKLGKDLSTVSLYDRDFLTSFSDSLNDLESRIKFIMPSLIESYGLISQLKSLPLFSKPQEIKAVLLRLDKIPNTYRLRCALEAEQIYNEDIRSKVFRTQDLIKECSSFALPNVAQKYGELEQIKSETTQVEMGVRESVARNKFLFCHLCLVKLNEAINQIRRSVSHV